MSDEDDNDDELLPAPTEKEVQWLSILFRIVIVCVAPCALVIYRSRLLNLHAFTLIKKAKESRVIEHRGIVYNRMRKLLHIFFCCFPERKLNYIEYVQFKNKNKRRYELWGEVMNIIVVLLIVFFHLWNKQIEEFKLPWYYLLLICLLLAQK